MGRAAIAEETIGIDIGVEIQFLHLPNTGCDQAVNDVAFEVEVRLAGGAGDEEAGVFAIGVKEAGAECVVDLVGWLSNARPDRGLDAIAPGAELLHRLDRRVGDSGESTAPAGMGRGDDRCVVVREQNRRAIGGEDSEQKVGPIGDHRIGTRASILRPRRVRHDNLGGMNLVDGRQLRIGKQSGNGKAAVAGNRLGVVAAAIADVQARAVSDRDAAPPAEKAVRKLTKADRADNLDAQRVFLMIMSSSAWLPTMKS